MENRMATTHNVKNRSKIWSIRFVCSYPKIKTNIIYFRDKHTPMLIKMQ